jgi:hypothetical protein
MNLVAVNYVFPYNRLRHREGVMLTMNNTKLSKLLLGSALILGLGASNGSFAAGVAAPVLDDAASALIMASPQLTASAQKIIGSALTLDAAQMSILSNAMSNPTNTNGAQFAALLTQEQNTGASIFHRVGTYSRSKLQFLKNGVRALVIAAGLGVAAAQTAEAGVSSPLGAQVIGNSALQCMGGVKGEKGWTDANAKKVAALTFVAMGEAKTVAAWNKLTVEKAMPSFPGETAAQVAAREREAFNSPACDIARVEGGVRPARQ